MEYRGTFPCFIKPKHGSSSINAIKINNQTELDFFKSYIGDYIIQDFIEGPEYTIDIFCDFEGNPIYLTPRLRLATRSGEVMKTRVVYDDNLENQVLRIVEALKPKGPMTVQAIQSKVDGEFWFIEINARFGGGCPLSMKAGADAAGALYDLLSNKKLQFQRRAANMEFTFLRFDQSIFIPQKSDGGYERTKSCHIRPGRYTLP
jgi:carbamoyl-phosphate synthase large subunit